jgi:recombination protein RecT
VSTAITKPTSLKQWLQSDQLKNEVGKVLPKHMRPERMLRVAITALTRTPKLNECTQESFVKCLLDLSSFGLEPNGRDAHLIPFANKQTSTTECTLIIDYKGLVTLCYRSGIVKKIHADVVREGDLFVYDLGEVKQHTPWTFRVDADKPKQAGEVIAAYCLVQMANDTSKCEVMTTAEIESIRKRSRSGESGPWKTDWSEMAKKTVFRRCSKWLPMSPELADALERDDDKIVDAVSVTASVQRSSLNIEQLMQPQEALAASPQDE